MSFSCFGELRGDLVPEHRSGTGTDKKQKKTLQILLQVLCGVNERMRTLHTRWRLSPYLPIATLSVRSQCNCASHLPTVHSVLLLCAVVAVSTVNSNVLNCCVCWSQLSVVLRTWLRDFFDELWCDTNQLWNLRLLILRQSVQFYESPKKKPGTKTLEAKIAINKDALMVFNLLKIPRIKLSIDW